MSDSIARASGAGRPRPASGPALTLVSVFATLLLGACASEPVWNPLFTQDSAAWSYDSTTLRRPRGNKVRMVLLRDNQNPVRDPLSGDEYRSARLDWEFACTERTVTRHAVSLFADARGTGRNLTDMSGVSGPTYADPQTLNASFRAAGGDALPERIRSGSIEDRLLRRFCH
jgi:hypothetical protein